MSEPATLENDPEPVHGFFGLTYASYLVVQRSVLQAMPVEWQRKFVALMSELRETVDTDQIPSDFWVRARSPNGNCFMADPFREYRRPPKIPMREGKSG